MVTGDRRRAALAQEGRAFVRIGVIADDVADAGDARDAAGVQRREHRAERLAVALDSSQDGHWENGRLHDGRHGFLSLPAYGYAAAARW
ncbi:hypothetical protein AYO46_08955 [Betaproteobacteria bacterium SCGC AG-212-J23]|nr:hypothetical protein AYO46_08955 [Betaproteobacteria bacterium SCGC AG-212-J23]